MRHERKKIGKIVEELTMFFFSMGAEEINSKILVEGNTVSIILNSNYNIKKKEHIKTMEKYLSCGRNLALEDTFWELAGSGDPGECSELLLIGSMADEVKIDISEEKVNILLKREI